MSLHKEVLQEDVSISLWCYECVSTQPGCGTPFNWLYHWTKVCPEENDVCVKIIEQRSDETLITRSCLSSLRGIRTDIPADHYEGCRPAAVDVHLANYVNNSIKELDIYRNYYDNTTWCFCFLDQRCNSGVSIRLSLPLLYGSATLAFALILWR
ncbi:QVR superfamily protein crim isoform X2 [Rhynchophorus ferrugineus]|uniref:QVR superfamily protein crim isoform X2 n=1 Tax=Rhynchophorus ferrugineus TaxID=354439 RepID=UPI003FCD1BFE